MNILHFILGLLVAIAWLAISWLLIRKTRIKPKKTGMYAAVIILFILCAGIHSGIQIGVPIAKNAIHENMPLVDEFMNTNRGVINLLVSVVDTSGLPQSTNELEAKILIVMGRIVFWVYIVLAFILTLNLCIRIIQALKKPEEQEAETAVQ